MAYSDFNELLHLARESFISGKYATAEPLLKQLLLANNREPEIYQMLATIFYDQGKFNKAIKTFRRALEINPNYTDASIGLSIILNDLGRYEEGKEVFKEAQDLLAKKKSQMDSFVKEKIAKKHLELAGMYYQYFSFMEAAEQYKKALSLISNKDDVVIRIADCYIKMDDASLAIKELKSYLSENQRAVGPRLKLGIIYYNANRIIDATEEWERILELEPNHSEAKSYIRMAQNASLTDIGV